MLWSPRSEKNNRAQTLCCHGNITCNGDRGEWWLNGDFSHLIVCVTNGVVWEWVGRDWGWGSSCWVGLHENLYFLNWTDTKDVPRDRYIIKKYKTRLLTLFTLVPSVFYINITIYNNIYLLSCTMNISLFQFCSGFRYSLHLWWHAGRTFYTIGRHFPM